MPLGEWLKRSVNCVKSVPIFCRQRSNASFGQPFFSLVLGHAVLGDVVGPHGMNDLQFFSDFSATYFIEKLL